MSDEEDTLAKDVSRVLTALDFRPHSRRPPVLVALIGLPGTGKSYLAAELRRRTGFLVLESDTLRKVLFPRPRYSALESRRLFAAIHAAIDHLLAQRVSCILDATNLLEQYRRPLCEIAEERGAKLILIEVTAPRPEVHKRLSGRSRYGGTSDADIIVYERMRPQMEPVQREHFIIDTSEDISDRLDEIVATVMASTR